MTKRDIWTDVKEFLDGQRMADVDFVQFAADYLLTPAEVKIIEAIAHGSRNAEIAKIVGISEDAVRDITYTILDKLNARGTHVISKGLALMMRPSALAQVSQILGGEEVLGKRLETRMDLMALGLEGVTKDAVIHLAKELSLSSKQMVRLLPVTERTLQRYAVGQHLSPIVSEQVLHIAELLARGIEVFGDKGKFLGWMGQPSPALSDHTPLDLLGSRFGMEMVLDELGRMEHGVYS